MSGAERIENKCIKDKKNSSGNYICPSQQLLLLLSRFSHVRLCATPEMAAYQAPPSLGFSRQEPWSGLPFPSPMHESEKWKWSRSVVSDPQRPHGPSAFQTPPSMGFSRQEYWSGVPLPSPHYSNTSISRAPTSQVDWLNHPVLSKKSRVWSLGLGNPLEKGKATHSSNLAWRSPWTEEPGRLLSIR